MKQNVAQVACTGFPVEGVLKPNTALWTVLCLEVVFQNISSYLF